MSRSPHLTWKGTPKITYATEREAVDAIPTVARHQRMFEPTAYRCAECDQFHIGNESPLPEWPLRTRGATVAMARPQSPQGADR